MTEEKLLPDNLVYLKSEYGALQEESGTRVEVNDGVLTEIPIEVPFKVYSHNFSRKKRHRRTPSNSYTIEPSYQDPGATTFGNSGLRSFVKKPSDQRAKAGRERRQGSLQGKSNPNYDSGEESTSSGSSTEIYTRSYSSVSSNSNSIHSCHAIGTTANDMMSSDADAVCSLVGASILALVFMVCEYFGGYLSSSLAVFADAGHMTSDFVGFIVSVIALKTVSKPANASMSFGYHRAEILGSLCNVVILWLVTGLLTYAAIVRCISFEFDVDATIMMIMGALGVMVNLLMLLIINRFQACCMKNRKQGLQGLMDRNLSLRATKIHIVGDVLMSGAVFVAGIIIYQSPAYKIADPIVTFIFGFTVVVFTIPLFIDIVHILMEGCPKNIDFAQFSKDLRDLPQVKAFHDVHVWALSSTKNAMAVHLCVDPKSNAEEILTSAQKLVRQKYRIYRSTIQIEPYQADMDTCRQCQPLPKSN